MRLKKKKYQNVFSDKNRERVTPETSEILNSGWKISFKKSWVARNIKNNNYLRQNCIQSRDVKKRPLWSPLRAVFVVGIVEKKLIEHLMSHLGQENG